ncbi:MAG TPA: MBL fold metallo-hydrolase [Myxococcota bacterium]|nr:MBL fold metallo-hydrolase [Myxococcota bacterium]
MLRRVLVVLLSLVLAAVLYAALGLFLAKRAIKSLAPPLPSVEEVLAFDPSADLPVRLSWLNTASQPMPRSAVLERSLDPTPKGPFVMSFPAFVLEWADGRIFLIDLGMDRAEAEAFGKPTQWLAGADALQPLGSAAERLGGALARVSGVAFTHEHIDHTEGATDLCRLHPAPIQLFQNRLQVEESNFTTRPGQRVLEAAKCLERHVLDGGPLFGLPGFPGLSFFAAAGHTPGSQVFVAHLRTGDAVRTWVFTGDVVNQIDGVRQNIPKPRLYSLLIVPESTARLDVLRRFLAGLERDHGVGLLVSHDQLSIEASGLPAF